MNQRGEDDVKVSVGDTFLLKVLADVAQVNKVVIVFCS